MCNDFLMISKSLSTLFHPQCFLLKVPNICYQSVDTNLRFNAYNVHEIHNAEAALLIDKKCCTLGIQ